MLYKTYSGYECITLGSDNKMVISSTISDAFLIRSIRQDCKLSGLSSIIYDIKPFELNLVIKWVEVKHCRHKTNQEESLFLDKQDKKIDSKPEPRGNHQTQGKDLQHSDSNSYAMEDEVLTSGSGALDKIYLDSGAGRSVFKNLSSLTNIVQVKRSINTYAEPVKITHQGALVFCGIHISPV
ncbi:hypothetical protein O181_062306 [Austropuccinia psidii MF-1]|uniref:Uncharacterized protein n=1 Tax=Austropuccinia psidii MF-1 TaxID=1389203 RepID=A0A9Q3EPH9_9BASI|nr:hypothetical protein [Austropuccinia psidii MF-1]